jgi:acetyl-CoA decarbonylase/synthase complex subunit gamma
MIVGRGKGENMTIEEIDLYRLEEKDIKRYLPDGQRAACGAGDWDEFAHKLLDGTARARECEAMDPRMALALDAILSLNIRLAESDPMQQKVTDRLVEFNSPDESSPVLLTGNSVVTHRILQTIFDATRVPAFLVVVDTNGLTADNAVAAGAFTPMAMMRAMEESGITSRSMSRRIIIPGLARDLKGSIERVTRWKVDVGPVSGFELPLYLLKNEL